MYSIFETLLERDHVTVADVSRATGINQSTLSNWKRRNNLISGKNAQLIADYFGVSVDYLMNGRDSVPEGVPSYYFDEEAREAARFLHDNPQYKALFQASQKVRPEDIAFVKEMIERASK